MKQVINNIVNFIYSIMGLEDLAKRKAWLESVKEVGRWSFSIVVSLILTQIIIAISTAITNDTISATWSFSVVGIDFSFPIRPIFELVVLPLIIRFSDKFKFVKEKENIRLVNEDQTHTESTEKTPSGVIPF